MVDSLQGYEDRLMGLLPPERIARVQFPRPPAELVAGYRKLGDLTSTVADVLDGLGLVGVIPAGMLPPVAPGQRTVGPALTVRYVRDRVAPGYGQVTKAKARLAGHFEAYGLAEPGDVLVVAGGDPGISCLGGLSTRLAQRAGLAGSIVDGGIRDVAGIRALGYPTWARGITPRTGKFRYEVIEINGAVECAGVQVNPGDLILADDDGIVVVPLERAEEVYRLAAALDDKTSQVERAIAGNLSPAELKRILAPEKW